MRHAQRSGVRPLHLSGVDAAAALALDGPVLFFNKVLPLFVLPFGIVCLLLAVAIGRKKKAPALAALLVLYFCSLPVVADFLLATLERQSPVVPVAAAGPADAVVVLGGILGVPNAEGTIPNWMEHVGRFEAGVALLQAGRAQRLIFTGAKRQWLDGETTEGELLRRLAIARGVPAEKILVSRMVDNTSTEAQAVAELLRADGKRNVILVTTGWHMPRALWLFRRAGIECTPFPVALRHDSTSHLTWLAFVPTAGAWQQTETALREWYGYAIYRVFR